jgi:HPt (histidine-containing phosphotransfer) domain-containing protein
MAFSMPGGEASDRRRARPIDLAHLSRQTMDDRELEREVLGLFVDQAQTVKRQLENSDVKERLFLAHSLKGSSRSVGAAAIADCCGALEKNPTDKVTVARLKRLIDEACDFVASIDR